MTAIPDWLGSFDLGEFLGIGLDSTQIGYLAGAIFLVVFGLLALRRAKCATGPMLAIWLTIAIWLIATAVLAIAHGFPEQIPDDVKPWTEFGRLCRVAAVLSLLWCSLVFLTARWVSRPIPNMTIRLIGAAIAAVCLWLASDWFADLLPEEARPWMARNVMMRLLTVAGLVYLGAAIWFGAPGQPPHIRWAVRTLSPLAFCVAIVLGTTWYAMAAAPGVPIAELNRLIVVLSCVSTGTCGLVAGGAYFLRDRLTANRSHPRCARASADPIPLVAIPPLPVAVLLDDHGQPILPRPTCTSPHCS
jgi:hypothetical protein